MTESNPHLPNNFNVRDLNVADPNLMYGGTCAGLAKEVSEACDRFLASRGLKINRSFGNGKPRATPPDVSPA